MSSNKEILTDDYVADLLAKEASDCSLKYSSMGLDAYSNSAKRPNKTMTPNTRFLNHIIRDTDNHNRALLAQERADSQARLRELEAAEQKKQQVERDRARRLNPGARDTRKRMLGDIAAIIGGPSKKRKPDDDELTDNIESGQSRSKRPKNDVNRRDHGRHEEQRRPEPHDQRQTSTRNSRKELFEEEHDGKRERTHRRTQDRSRSRERHRHRSDKTEERHSRRDDTDKDRGRNHTRHETGSEKNSQRRRSRDLFQVRKSRDRNSSTRLDPKPASTTQELRGNSSDSDPLDDIIGPKPPSPVRRRGRGAVAGSSGIDSRFASGYDPKTDVALDHEDDDWGTSLEALRDRQRWKQQGADRLRAAGFTEDQVKKWEKGGDKNEEDVRWSKKGEQREWDRGKSLTALEDGSEV